MSKRDKTMSQNIDNYKEEFKRDGICDLQLCNDRVNLGDRTNTFLANLPSYQLRPQEGCNRNCSEAGGWYKIRVRGNDTRLGQLNGKCLGYLSLYYRPRSLRSTPWSMAIIPDNLLDNYNQLEDCPFSFWKVAPSLISRGNDNTTPTETPFDLINYGMIQYDSSIRNSNGDRVSGRSGSVNSYWCASTNQCGSRIYTPAFYTESEIPNRPSQETGTNLRFYFNYLTTGSNSIVMDHILPLKQQLGMYVKAQGLGNENIRRRLFAYVLNINWSGNQFPNGEPYLEVVFDGTGSSTVPGNRPDNSYNIEFEFIPMFNDNDVSFVYATGSAERDATICMAECCKSTRNINENPSSWTPEDNRVCGPFFERTGISDETRRKYLNSICQIDPSLPKSLLNMENPECLALLTLSGEESFNRYSSQVETFCQYVDKTRADITEDERERLNSLCACYNSAAFYQNLREQMIQDIQGTPAEGIFRRILQQDFLKPYCWYKDCRESPLSPAITPYVANCTPNLFVTCIQYIDVTLRDGRWQFDNKDGLNTCIVQNDSSIGDGTSPQPSPSPAPSNGKKQGGKTSTGNIIFYVLLAIIVITIIIGIVIYISRNNSSK